MDFGMGHLLACIGAAVAIILPGIGSALALSKAGQTLAGVSAENPKIFWRALVLQLLPSTQGIYGFVAAFMIISTAGISGGLLEVSTAQGWAFLAASMPVAIIGFFSALYQSKVASAGIQLMGKQPNAMVKGLVMAGIVETYAIFGLLITIFLTTGIL